MPRPAPGGLPFRVVWRLRLTVRNNSFDSLARAERYAALVREHNPGDGLTLAIQRWDGERWVPI